MRVAVFDVEATNRDTDNGFSANPWHPDNHAVSIYVRFFSDFDDPKKDTELTWSVSTESTHGSVSTESTHGKVRVSSFNEHQFSLLIDIMNTHDVWVGHNIEFDLLSIFNTIPIIQSRVKDEIYFALREKRIWDTALAHYLSSGHLDTFPSLDAVASYWKLPQKPEDMNSYWEAGLDTLDILHHYPRPFNEYATHDVRTTTAIFRKQFDSTHHMENPALYKYQMLARKATILMELRGIAIDKRKLHDYKDTLSAETQKELITERLAEAHGLPKEAINIDSTQQISSLIYGGEFEFETQALIGAYKSGERKGQPKYKKVRHTRTLLSLVPHPTKERNRNGYYVVDEEILEATGIGITKNLLDYRKANKEIKLIDNLSKHARDLTTASGMIIVHPQYQHTSTATGRISCSNPNLQNIKTS